MQYPLISCLCVTKKRPLLLRRAILCFERQSYPEKELVIVYEIDDLQTVEVISGHIADNRIIPVPVKTSPGNRLGYLRNLAVSQASGMFACQWDDDDWYHPERLSFQINMIQGTSFSASILSRWFISDSVLNKMYVSHSRLWEGSILCERSILQRIPYKNESRGEDTAVVRLLASRRLICDTNDMPHLYIYSYHGSNTFGNRHFSKFFKYGTQLSDEDAALIHVLLQQNEFDLNEKALYERLKYYL